MSWRSSDELAERVRLAARPSGRSMDDYVTAVLEAATDPALAGDEAVHSRAAGPRRAAGPDGAAQDPPAEADLARARAAASGGTNLSSLVERDR